jgi:hypothetical protein
VSKFHSLNVLLVFLLSRMRTKLCVKVLRSGVLPLFVLRKQVSERSFCPRRCEIYISSRGLELIYAHFSWVIVPGLIVLEKTPKANEEFGREVKWL